MRLFLFILILSGLIGCTAQKSLTEIDRSKSDKVKNLQETTKSMNDSSIVENTKTIVNQSSTKESEVSKNENTVTKNTTTNFDTSKPIDPGTGKPPVASISETTSEKTSNTRFSEAQINNIRTEIEIDVRREYENRHDNIISSYQSLIEKLNRKSDVKED